MRILVVETMPNTHLGAVGEELQRVGIQFETLRAWDGDEVVISSAGYAALFVPGGWPSALDDDNYPYLEKIAVLMRLFGGNDKPVLGICLGAQLLARAHGGKNELNGVPEFGWSPLSLTSDGRNDPLFSKVGSHFTSFQWHRDTFHLPSGAVRLVIGSRVENQCFRIGRASYGMQFHFEATRDVVETWTHENANRVAVHRQDWSRRFEGEAALHAKAADTAGRAIAAAFAKIVTCTL